MDINSNEYYESMGLSAEEASSLSGKEVKIEEEIIENEVENNEEEVVVVDEDNGEVETIEGETEEEGIDRIANKFDSFEDLVNSISSIKEKLKIEDDVDVEDLSELGKLKYYKKLESKLGESLSNKNLESDEQNREKEQEEIFDGEDIDFFKDSEMDEKEKETFNGYANEYLKNKGISEKTREEIKEKYRLSDSIIDQYLSNLDFKYSTDKTTETTRKGYEIVNSIYKNVAPEQEMTEILNWGQKNLSEYQVNLFNKELSSKDKNQAISAAKELKSLYESGKGSKKVRKIIGKSNKNSGVDKFNSKSEYLQAITSPKYKNDVKYRNEVEKKLMKSDIY